MSNPDEQALREKAIADIKVEQKNNDTESAHLNADNIICDLLVALGYADVVEEYDNVRKWYA